MKSHLTLNPIRRILPTRVKTFAKTLLGLPLSKIHEDWAILSQIGPVDQPHTVLDLGARNGWFLISWQDWCPNAKIHAFEPDQTAFEMLDNAYSGNDSVIISPFGVGESESTETFYFMPGSKVSSSFLEHDAHTWDQLKFETGEIEQRQLEITTLDNYTDKHSLDSIYLIKIDIQGYELRALKGAITTLTNTRYVLVESGIRPLYKNASTFTEVHDFMVDQGFHLMNFRAWHQGNNVLMETDMLFRKDNLAEEVDSSAHREYIHT